MKNIFFHILLALICEQSFCQDIFPVRLIKYTQNDGLSSNNIKKIIYDKFGFLWVATQDGLNRFDGKEFVTFRKGLKEGSSLLGFDIRDLIYTENHIVALAATGGISVLNTLTRTVTYHINLDSTDNNVWNIGLLKIKNKLWVNTSNGVFIVDSLQQFSRHHLSIPFLKNTPGNVFKINKQIQDHFGNVWVFIDNHGIVIYDLNTFEVVGQIKKEDLGYQSSLSFNDAIFSNTNTVLVATSKGLQILRYDKFYNISKQLGRLSEVPEFKTSQVYSLAASKNYIFLGTDLGLFRVSKDGEYLRRFYEYDDENSESWLTSIKSFCVLDDSTLWVGCKNGLAYLQLITPPFRSFFSVGNSGKKLDNVFSIQNIDSDNLYVGLEKGLIKLDIKNNTYSTLDTLNSYFGIEKGPRGIYFASNQKGTFVIQNKKLSKISHVFPEFTGKDDVVYNSLVSFGDSLYIFGTETLNGVLIWNYRRRCLEMLSTETTPDKISSNIVNTLYKDKSENLWVLSDNLITIYDKQINRLKELRLKMGMDSTDLRYYFSICETSEHYWLAVYGTGIVVVDKQFKISKIYNTETGLCNNGVYKIFNYADKFLVITSNNGLSIFNLHDSIFSNYYAHHGLHNNTFEENVGVMHNDIVYAGGLKGFTRIDPSKMVFNMTEPKLFINNIKILRQSGSLNTNNILTRLIDIPPDVLQTNINFSGINYTDPLHTTFAYRLLEIDTNWINLGTQNNINLVGLNPGSYTLQVISANEMNVWNKKPVELALNYLPKWYQTWWFKSLIVTMVITILYSLYLYRLSQIRKQEAIRKNIASDLHDDIGSTLNTVKIFAHLAKIEPNSSEHLSQIEESLTEASVGLRDMIWVLDEKYDTLQELMERIRRYALPVCNANKIIFESQVVDAIKNKILSKTEKRNLLLISKELINNSIKHAQCTLIELTFNELNSKNFIYFSDNGIGFSDVKNVDGYGIKNIKERAFQIHYNLQVSSEKGEGVRIALKKI